MSQKVSFRVGTGLLLLPDQPKVNISATETRTPVDLVSPQVRVKTVLERPGGSFDTAFSGTYSYLLRNQYAQGADGVDASGHLIRLELGLRKRIEWIELEAMFGINYIAINDRVDGVDLPIANNLRPSFGAAADIQHGRRVICDRIGASGNIESAAVCAHQAVDKTE